MDVLFTCKYEDEQVPASMKMIRSKMKSVHNIFSIITLWELFVAMETRVPILPGPKPNAINPHPNDASDIIWLRFAYWLRRYSSLKMFTDIQPDRQTDRQTTGIL